MTTAAAAAAALIGPLIGSTGPLASTGCGTTRARRDVEHAQIRYQLAADDFRGQRLEAAQAEARQALALDPENADAHNLLGLIALQQGADYLRQVEIDSCLTGKDGEAVRRDAATKFHDAEEHLRRATELRAQFSEAWNNLAVAALHLERYDEAARAAGSALADAAYASPEIARANLGWAELQQRDLGAAWKDLHEAVARAPGFCVGRYRLAKVYVERAQYDEAVEELDAVTGNPACPIQEAFLLGGLVHDRRRDRDGARALFGKCVAMAPRACVAGECKRYAEMMQ